MPTSYPYLQFQTWNRQYGPIFSLAAGKDTVIVLADHETAHELLNKRSQNYSHRPTMPMAGELLYKGHHMLFRPFDEKYKAHRRNMGPLFTEAASRTVGPVQDMESIASLRQLLDFSEGSEKARLDARQYVKHVKDQSRLLDGYCALVMALHRYTASIAYLLVYGFRIETGREPELTNGHLVEKNFAEAMKPGVWPCDIIPALNYLPQWLAPWKKTAERWYEFEKEHHMKSISRAKKTPAWNWTKAVLGNKAARGLDEVSLVYDAGILNNAGLDTTAQTLEMFILAAVTNPGKMKIAQEELDRVVGRDRIPSLEDRKDLPYMSAVIEEVLRWRPILMGGIVHSNLRDDVFRGYRIPKGSVVIPNVWSIHMDERVYKDPHLFLPERWLENPSLPDHVGFGFGRRVCMGEHIARASMFTMMARLFWAFDIKKELDDAGNEIDVDSFNLTDYFIVRPKPFPVRLILRHGTVRDAVDAAWEKVEKDPDVIMEQVGGYFKNRMKY
ncbi:Fumitremorgin C synthase [Cytospora mali]|uniref:Fumitremorgin C synthase n=1 Tax=Cytospora mali TaxID=578113 RepID=A0A194VBF8_CYTMA|nr:Fumitremorgin C synthase [Valsa mali var. pyri (nom. inval.)]